MNTIPLSTVMSQADLGIRYEISDYVDWGSTFKKMNILNVPEQQPVRVQRFRNNVWEDIKHATFWDAYSCVWEFANQMSGFKCRVKHGNTYKYAYLALFTVVFPGPPAALTFDPGY